MEIAGCTVTGLMHGVMGSDSYSRLDSHFWAGNDTSIMNGSEYASSISVRYCCLFSRSLGTRSRNCSRKNQIRKIKSCSNRNCSRDCVQPETMNHMLQNYYATHSRHVMSHDEICSYIKRSLQQ